MRRAYSPKDILNKTYKTLPWDGEWAKAFGLPAENETWFISGASASGKSSFVMQLAKKLCEYGTVLYESYEEGVGKSFQDRLKRHGMQDMQGRFRVAMDDGVVEVIRRLKKRKSAKFIIIDSFQESGWDISGTKELISAFPKKCFIFVSQIAKGQPLGKPAVRLKYLAGVKISVSGYRAYCQGRAIGEAGASFTVWEDGLIQTSNNVNAGI